MARPFQDREIIIASHNSGKISEIGDLLRPFGIECASAASLGLTEPVEDGTTFSENARIKAVNCISSEGRSAIADDSGLVVHALNGDPGIYSARWAGPKRDFKEAMCEVERRLSQSGSTDRTAHFVCALCIAWSDGHVEEFIGRVNGLLVWPPRGDRGFGYDPIFVADGQKLTFGEMKPKKKHAISHRAKAFNQLVNSCFARRIRSGTGTI